MPPARARFFAAFQIEFLIGFGSRFRVFFVFPNTVPKLEASLLVWSAICLRVAACLGAWLALSGLSSYLGGFARELAGLKMSISRPYRRN
jgi:hypothetical protein